MAAVCKRWMFRARQKRENYEVLREKKMHLQWLAQRLRATPKNRFLMKKNRRITAPVV